MLVLPGAADDFLHRQNPGVGAGDDRHFLIAAGFQRRADLADTFGDRDQVGGFAAELRGQQGVFDGQRGDAGPLEFDDGAHDVERVAVAVVGVGNHRQLGDTADASGLFSEFAEGDQGKVRGAQHLQRCDRTPEDPDFEAQVGGDAGRHRVENRGRVVAGVGGEQLAKIAAQILMGKPGHMSSTNGMEGLEQKCQRRRNKRLSRAQGENDDEFAGSVRLTSPRWN
ncbi:hypothetical protein D9M73_128910 [compost metagenome]